MNRIKEFRTSLGISQQKLAQECGWIKNYSRISNYESNTRSPSVKDCWVIINTLCRLSNSPISFDDVFPPSVE